MNNLNRLNCIECLKNALNSILTTENLHKVLDRNMLFENIYGRKSYIEIEAYVDYNIYKFI